MKVQAITTCSVLTPCRLQKKNAITVLLESATTMNSSRKRGVTADDYNIIRQVKYYFRILSIHLVINIIVEIKGGAVCLNKQ